MSESDDSCRRRILDAIPAWGAFAGEVSDASGEALDAAGRYLNVPRRAEREPFPIVSDENDDPAGADRS